MIDATRFWKKAKTGKVDDCWLWQGNILVHGGYGRYGQARAHRIAWILIHGAIPPGQILMHTCDTPACVNPQHLRLGTQADNMRDKATKMRCHNTKGEASGRAKLTNEDVRAIRQRYQRGHGGNGTPGNSQELAMEFGVSTRTILQVARGQTWTHV